MTITIDLLRHGEVAGGLRLRGYKDDPLSDKGWQQLRDVIKGKTLPWDTIISSPLQRCALFAEEVSKQHEKPLHIKHGFKEISFGDWEGQLFSDLYKNKPEEMNRYWNNPSVATPPNGEPYDDFEARVHQAWDELVAEHANKHILLVAHGGTIRALLRKVINFPVPSFFKIEVPNASLSRITIDDDISRLTFINGQLE